MKLDADLVHRAREEFIQTGALSERFAGLVRADILTSWRRSKAFGAQAGAPTLLPFDDELDQASRLVRAAEPVLRELAENLAGLDAGVLLADREAKIIKRWVADTSILPDLDRICSDAGFGAPEDRVGTNGIGTVAELGRAQMIVGPEHYADTLVGFACVGAPIHSPTTRRVEGIITMSCRADAATPLLTPLMVSTAADISHRLFEGVTTDERRMLDAYLTARRTNRLVAAVGRDLLIAGARVTRLLNELTHRDVLWDVVSGLVRASDPSRHHFETSDGAEVVLTCDPVRDSGRLVGAIVTVDPSSSPAGGSSNRRRGGLRRPALDVPGSNTRWLHVVDTASRLARDRVPAVVTGEPGAGKWTLVEAMAGAERHAPTTCVVHCGSPGAVAAISACLAPEVRSRHRLLLLRRLDALAEGDLRTLGSQLDRLGSVGRPWIVATVTPPDTASGVLDHVADRLGGVRLRVPALRERPDDIAVIARHLMRNHERVGDVRLSSKAVVELARARWPGNIRQLDGVLRAASAGRVGEIAVEDLPPDVRAGSSRRALTPIEEMECDAIVRALREADGNKVAAAELVGLSRSTIYRKIRAYGIDLDAAFF